MAWDAFLRIGSAPSNFAAWLPDTRYFRPPPPTGPPPAPQLRFQPFPGSPRPYAKTTVVEVSSLLKKARGVTLRVMPNRKNGFAPGFFLRKPKTKPFVIILRQHQSGRKKMQLQDDA